VLAACESVKLWPVLLIGGRGGRGCWPWRGCQWLATVVGALVRGRAGLILAALGFLLLGGRPQWVQNVTGWRGLDVLAAGYALDCCG